MRTVFMPDVLITNSYCNTKKCAKTFQIAVILLIPGEFNLLGCRSDNRLNGARRGGAPLAVREAMASLLSFRTLSRARDISVPDSDTFDSGVAIESNFCV